MGQAPSTEHRPHSAPYARRKSEGVQGTREMGIQHGCQTDGMDLALPDLAQVDLQAQKVVSVEIGRGRLGDQRRRKLVAWFHRRYHLGEVLMVRLDDLLEKARRNPGGLRFEELVWLLNHLGWSLARQNGSHQTFKKEGSPRLLTVQPGPNGKAMPYQVKQLLETVD